MCRSDTRSFFIPILILSAGLASAAWVPGLMGGHVNGSFNLTDYPAVTNRYQAPHAATNNSTSGDPWANNRTWVYWGQIHLDGGPYSFAENIDDYTHLKIDGTVYIQNGGNWGDFTTSPVLTLPAGWHDIEIRFGNGSMGAGPNNCLCLEGFRCGFGMYRGETKPTSMNVCRFPSDPGDMTLFRHDDGLGFGDTVLIATLPAGLEGGFTPATPRLEGLSAGDEIPFSATGKCVDRTSRYHCVGYLLEERDSTGGWSAPVTNLGTTAFSYIHGEAQTRLTWLWEPEAFRLFSIPEGGSGRVVFDPPPDEEGFYPRGQEVRLTAVCSDAAPRTRFSGWRGDFPEGHKNDNPLLVTIDGPATISPTFEILGEAFYVNALGGDDANGGRSPGQAVATLGKGLALALEANRSSKTNNAGQRLAKADLRLQGGTVPYHLDGTHYVDGTITLTGQEERAKVESDGQLAVATIQRPHLDEPGNGRLLLDGIDWRTSGNASLLIGCNMDHFTRDDPVDGELAGRNGSFVWETDGQLRIGCHDLKSQAPMAVQGRLILESGMTPIALAFKNAYLGTRGVDYHLASSIGILDASQTEGGSLTVAGELYAGKDGKRGIGKILLGRDWTLDVGDATKSVYIGMGSNDSATTGLVSFAESGRLSINASTLGIGYGSGNRNGQVSGELEGRNGTEASIHAKTLRVAYSAPMGKTRGCIDFSGPTKGSLIVGEQLVLARRNSVGKILLGKDWDVRLGTAEKPMTSMTIAVGDNSVFADGLFSMEGGTFSAYVGNLYITFGKSPKSHGCLDTGKAAFQLTAKKAYVGHDQDGGTVYGELDASGASKASVDIGTLTIGYFHGERSVAGRVALANGTGVVGTLSLGVPGNPIPITRESILSLDSFAIAITNGVKIRRSGKVRVRVAGASSGLCLEPGATMSFQDSRSATSGPAIEIAFTALPEQWKAVPLGNHEGFLWGLKLSGDQVAELTERLETGAIVYEAGALGEKAAALVGCHYDLATDATCLGLPIRKKLEKTLLLLR